MGAVAFDLSNPYVVVGLLFGGLLPFLFGGMSMTAVGRAAEAVVVEVRRQFRENPGIMTDEVKPEYGRAVDILTKAAIKEMIVPSLLPVLSPIVLFFVDQRHRRQGRRLRLARRHADGRDRHRPVRRHLDDLGRRRLGQRQEGDRRRLHRQRRRLHGKGSEAHKAAVTGDTVGDPYKDTSGPAVNPMIKITNIVALLLLAVLASGKIG